MTKEELAANHEKVFAEIMQLREAGQKEYAGGEDAFGNFNRLATELGVDRKQVLWVYAMKHKDGIAAHLRGHVSQREPVQGRIRDLINYLMILDGMLAEEEGRPMTASPLHAAPYGEVSSKSKCFRCNGSEGNHTPNCPINSIHRTSSL